MKDEPFDTIGADGFIAGRVVYYAQLYPRLREVARAHGYALALHGSLTKDLDVVAIPWTDEASDPTALAIALTERAGAHMPPNQPTIRLHARMAYTIHLGGIGGYIDLSVMPRAA